MRRGVRGEGVGGVRSSSVIGSVLIVLSFKPHNIHNLAESLCSSIRRLKVGLSSDELVEIYVGDYSLYFLQAGEEVKVKGSHYGMLI